MHTLRMYMTKIDLQLILPDIRTQQDESHKNIQKHHRNLYKTVKNTMVNLKAKFKANVTVFMFPNTC